MSYTGRLIDSLIDSVAKAEKADATPKKQHPEPKGTPMPTEVEDFIEAERNGRDGRAA
jgi:hypothetical protein